MSRDRTDSRRPWGLVRRLALSVGIAALVVGAVEVVLRLVGYDFEDPRRSLARIPLYYRRPTVPTGEAFYRRPGPQRWKGRVVYEQLRSLGATDDLAHYADERIITVTYDADGFRNPDDLDDWDVVFVGDSFVELGYLEDGALFTTQLGERLGLRVRNLGTAQTGPLTHLAYFESFGRSESTRDAVLCFFEGNDMEDLGVETERLRKIRRGEWQHVDLLQTHRPQPSFLVALRRLLTGKRKPSWRNAVFTGGGEHIPVTLYDAPRPWERRSPASRERMRDVLVRWAEMTTSAGIRPWFLFMPCKHRVLHGLLEYDPGAMERLPAWEPSDDAGALRALAEELGIGFVDPTAQLARLAYVGTLTYNTLYDSHFNADGATVVADVLAEAMGPTIRGDR